MENQRITRSLSTTLRSAEDKNWQIFGNNVIMRYVLSNFTSNELLPLRCVNTLWNEISCRYLRRSNIRISIDSTEKLNGFINRMDKRYQWGLPTNKFCFRIWNISIISLGEFSKKYGEFFEKYTIDACRPLRDYTFADDFIGTDELFKDKQIGTKIQIILNNSKNLQILKIKSDFEVTLNEMNSKLLQTHHYSLQRINIKYMESNPDQSEGSSDVVTLLVKLSPFLQDLKIELFPGPMGFSSFHISKLPIALKHNSAGTWLKRQGQLPSIELRTLFTPTDVKVVEDFLTCHLRKLSYTLYNPKNENPYPLTQSLTRLLANQSESLEVLSIGTMEDPRGAYTLIPRMQSLTTLSISFNEDDGITETQIRPFITGQFPKLISLDIGFYRYVYGLFKNNLFPSVTNLNLTLLESPIETIKEDWKIIFPNLKNLILHDRSWGQKMLKYCLTTLTHLESLGLRICNIGTWEGVRDILVGGQEVIVPLNNEIMFETPPIVPEYDVVGNGIGDDAEGAQVVELVPSLGNMKNLKTLAINCCRIEEVRGIVFLFASGQLHELKELHLRYGGWIPYHYKRILMNHTEVFSFNATNKMGL